jgi:hypothetical protein
MWQYHIFYMGNSVYNSIYFPQAKKCVGFLTFFTTISAGKKLCFAPSDAAIGKIFLGLIAGLPVSNGHSPDRLVWVTRAILDFLYLAQLPSHNDDTLQDLEDALTTFHTNKSIFVNLGIREDFNLPKLHSLQHYTSLIKLFGTTDNYNTEYSKQLHIDLAKDAYTATN